MILNAMTKYGAVEGVPCESEGIAVFKGIPFAAPPVGDLRWRAPQPPAAWEGVRKCDKYAPAAMQARHGVPFYVEEFPLDFTQVEYSEDCLYLNIWTPAKTADDKLAVMIWIHGGGNEVGFPNEPEHDGEFIAQRGVIYVNVSYRLNVFGFMAHPELTAESEYGASGNYGNLDNLAALKWVHENIAAFGGDPDNITIYGQSAGAMNTQALCSSPLAKGLFNRAITQSGGGAAPGGRSTSLEAAEQKGVEFMKVCGCKSIAELRTLPAFMIFGFLKGMGRGAGFSTCVDGYLLPKSTSDAAWAGEYHDVSYLIGSTAHESAAFTLMAGGPKPETYDSLRQKMVAAYGEDRADIALEMYGVKDEETAAAFDGDLMAANSMRSCNYWAELQLKFGRKPMYRYLFDRKVPDKDGNPSWESSFHSSDIWYVHGTIGRSWRGMTEDDWKTTNYMMDYWTNFAKTGDPNGEGLPTWTPYTADDKRVMLIDEAPKMDAQANNPGMVLL